MCVCVEGEEKQCRLNQQNIDDSKICFLKLNQTILTDDIQSDLLDQGLVAGLAVGQTLVHGSVISPAHTGWSKVGTILKVCKGHSA